MLERLPLDAVRGVEALMAPQEPHLLDFLRTGNVPMLQWCIDAGIRSPDNLWVRAACQFNQVAMLRWLFEEYGCTGCTWNDVVHIAISINSVSVAEWMLRSVRMTVSQSEMEWSSSYKMFRLLLEYASNGVDYEQLAISLARNGRLKEIKLLRGKSGWFSSIVMDYAVKGGHYRVVRWLHKKYMAGEIVSLDGIGVADRSIRQACIAGHIKLLRYLLSSGVQCPPDLLCSIIHTISPEVAQMLCVRIPKEEISRALPEALFHAEADVVRQLMRFIPREEVRAIANGAIYYAMRNADFETAGNIGDMCGDVLFFACGYSRPVWCIY